MKKLNNSFAQALVLGLVASVGVIASPANAQDDGAQAILDNCPNPITPGQICDPNADVISNGTGLDGRIEVVPVAPGGFILEGTGVTAGEAAASGGFPLPPGVNAANPLTNIDFTEPSQLQDPGSRTGAVVALNAPTGSDFQPFIGWTGEMKDLSLAGECPTCTIEGASFPPPRVENFLVFDTPGNVAGSDGVVDGIQLGGVAFDLISIQLPVYSDSGVPGVSEATSILLGWQLQAYKLDTNGQRIEDQIPLPPTDPERITIYANEVQGGLTATFPGLNQAETRALFDEAGEIVEDFNYSVSNVSESDSVTIPTGDIIPEPTTIISSILLSGGLLKLKKRK